MIGFYKTNVVIGQEARLTLVQEIDEWRETIMKEMIWEQVFTNQNTVLHALTNHIDGQI